MILINEVNKNQLDHYILDKIMAQYCLFSSHITRVTWKFSISSNDLYRTSCYVISNCIAILLHSHASINSGCVEIKLNVSLPPDIELVEPLQESSIWRQARGAATEVLGSGGVVGTSEKVFSGLLRWLRREFF